MKFIIVGGGNIGTVLAGELRRLHPYAEIYILTSNKNKWQNRVKVYNEQQQLAYTAENLRITEEFIPDGDIYFYTLPKQVLSSVITQHLNLLQNNNAVFMFLPGTGGLEYLLPAEKKITFIGLQRVPYIARIKEYGRSAYLLSKKSEIFYAEIGKSSNVDLKELFGIASVRLHNYLEVTLTPSNPLLHTARLFAIFSDKPIDYEYEREILFYEEWTNKTSEILIACDASLQKILQTIKGLELSYVHSLLAHYEVSDALSMTEKIKSIRAFKGIPAPMKQIDNRYTADLSSRYFQEDFSYGLLIIKAIGNLCDVETPEIDMILRWFETISKESLLDKNNRVIINKKFNLPQNAGIDSVEKLQRYYH